MGSMLTIRVIYMFLKPFSYNSWSLAECFDLLKDVVIIVEDCCYEKVYLVFNDDEFSDIVPSNELDPVFPVQYCQKLYTTFTGLFITQCVTLCHHFPSIMMCI